MRSQLRQITRPMRWGGKTIAMLGCLGLLGLQSLAEAKGLNGSVVILGDSLGEGLTYVSRRPSLAARSVAIQSSQALTQVNQVPKGTTVVVSLGTNDAVGNLKGADKAIDLFIKVAMSRNLKVIWAGPPCVFKPWNVNVKTLDALLAQKLQSIGTYVSFADESICNRAIRGADGVHFNSDGYQQMWNTIVASSPADFVLPGEAKSGDIAPQQALPVQPAQKKTSPPAMQPLAKPDPSLLGSDPKANVSPSRDQNLATPGANLGQIRPQAGVAAWTVKILPREKGAAQQQRLVGAPLILDQRPERESTGRLDPSMTDQLGGVRPQPRPRVPTAESEGG